MPRDLFPFEGDRALIDAYLRGVTSPKKSMHLEMIAADGTPYGSVRALWLSSPFSTLMCMLNDDGELHGQFDKSTSKMHYIVKAQNYILQVLGDPRRITMKAVIRTTTFAGQSDVATAPHLDDIELPVDRPWLIAGRLTVLAHRAQHNHTTVVEE